MHVLVAGCTSNHRLTLATIIFLSRASLTCFCFNSLQPKRRIHTMCVYVGPSSPHKQVCAYVHAQYSHFHNHCTKIHVIQCIHKKQCVCAHALLRKDTWQQLTQSALFPAVFQCAAQRSFAATSASQWPGTQGKA